MFEWIYQLFTVRVWPPLTFIEYLYSWLLFAIIVAIVLIITSVVLFIVKKIISKRKLSLHLYNGIKLVVRLFIIVFICVLFISVSPSLVPGGIPSEIAVIISAITGSIIAFSSTTILENFIAGLYILFTRPYRIGDLIQIGDKEGIVEEVSLNHTKIRRASGARNLVSNLSVIKSEIINFTVTSDLYRDVKDQKLKDLFKKQEFNRYWFTLELPKKEPRRTIRILGEISQKYEKIFNHPLEFYVGDLLHKIKFDVVVIADDPNLILKHKSGLVKDIYTKIFEK